MKRHVTEFGEGCRGDKARKVVWGSPWLEECFEACFLDLQATYTFYT